MHSKRALYKPAVTGKTTPKERRKPLAQGRLVTKPATDQKEPEDVPQGDLPVPLPGLSHTQPAREDSSARCRRDLSALMRDNIQPIREDPAISPRRDKPQISFHDSPRVVKPTRSLDVSDTESDLNLSKQSSLISPREVLVVDASQRSLSTARSTEVAVEMGYSNSPARIVCHSPGRVHSNLRHTGDVGLAAQIKVDRLPSVTIPGNDGDPYSDTEVPKHQMYSANPVVIKHKETSPKPKVVQTLFKDELNDSIDSTKHNRSGSPLRETNVNDSNSTTHSGHSDLSVESRSSDISEVIRETNKENFKDDTQLKSATMPVIGAKSVKKKKAPRFVASRYMANPGPTPVARGSTKSFDKSVMAKSSTSLSTTSRKTSNSSTITRKVASSHSTTIKRPTGSTTVQRKTTRKTPAITVEKQGHHGTPEARAVSAGGGKSSTPTAESANLLGADVSVDVSAIGPPSQRHIQSSMCASPSFEAFDLHHPPGSGKKKMGMSSSNAFRPPSARKKKSSHDWSTSTIGSSQDASAMSRLRKPEQHVTQLQLDLLYARYLQWVYMEAKSKHAFKQQEKHVMHQLQSLWEENERLRQKKEQMKVQLTRIKHCNNLDQTLDTQHAGLNTITSGLAQFRCQYNTLAQALDTTRHQIPTRGVHIPSNESLFLADLQHALTESEQLLGELSAMCRQHTPHTEKCAMALDNMSTMLQTENRELHRCGELLAAAKSLGVHESSLQIQQIQAVDT